MHLPAAGMHLRNYPCVQGTGRWCLTTYKSQDDNGGGWHAIQNEEQEVPPRRHIRKHQSASSCPHLHSIQIMYSTPYCSSRIPTAFRKQPICPSRLIIILGDGVGYVATDSALSLTWAIFMGLSPPRWSLQFCG